MTAWDLPALSGASTLSDDLYDVLEEAIITGALRPGERLHADELARHFGISRIPIRETLRALGAAGWVDLRPRHGASVRRRTDTELADLFEVRLLLEAEAARRASERRSEEQLRELQSLVEAGRVAAAALDDAEVARINTHFHAAVVACAHNAVLDTLLDGLSKRVRFYFSAAVTTRGKESVEEHARLVEALTRRDGDEAARLIQHHIAATRVAVAANLAALAATASPPSA